MELANLGMGLIANLRIGVVTLQMELAKSRLKVDLGMRLTHLKPVPANQM